MSTTVTIELVIHAETSTPTVCPQMPRIRQPLIRKKIHAEPDTRPTGYDFPSTLQMIHSNL